MKFDENLSAIHSYLCSDGYVVKNPKTQTQKYYRIGFRNTNKTLLKDFQKRFTTYFHIKPRLVIGQRCEIGNKELYYKLITKFGSFYSRAWKMPKLNHKLSKRWLRTFFDCEGWVFCKSHQNRHIGLDSVNELGLDQIITCLNKIGIKSIKKVVKRGNMFRILIYGKDNLAKFQKEIGFLHPEKKKKLEMSIKDYINYIWEFPRESKKLQTFINKLIKSKMKVNRGKYLRMCSKESNNLRQLKKFLKKLYYVECLTGKRINGLGTEYYELSIHKRKEVQKLIDLKLIPNLFKSNKA